MQKISPENWEKFRDIRLKALQSDPQAFGNTFEGESQKDMAYWKDKLSHPERRFYSAEEGGTFIAMAGLKKIAEDNWMVTGVYTVPEWRGKNTAQKLVYQVIDEAVKAGAHKASLMVNIQQEAAVGMYKKMGFKVIRIEHDQMMGDGKVYDEYYMEKDI